MSVSASSGHGAALALGSYVPTVIAAIRGRIDIKYIACIAASLRLGRPDHLAPFVSFVRDELSEIGWRTRYPPNSEIGEPRLDPTIVERTLDIAVEPADKLGGCPPGRAEANPSDCFVAGHGFTNGRDFGQCASNRVAVVTRKGRSLPDLRISAATE